VKEANAQILAIIAGAVVGLLFGCLITWFPIRMLFCAYYNAPDCEEIVLISFPFYCFIAPLAGGIIAFFLYRKRRSRD
jgi:membrane protease YdiL (CAAX protease family)